MQFTTDLTNTLDKFDGTILVVPQSRAETFEVKNSDKVAIVDVRCDQLSAFSIGVAAYGLQPYVLVEQADVSMKFISDWLESAGKVRYETGSQFSAAAKLLVKYSRPLQVENFFHVSPATKVYAPVYRAEFEQLLEQPFKDACVIFVPDRFIDDVDIAEIAEEHAPTVEESDDPLDRLPTELEQSLAIKAESEKTAVEKPKIFIPGATSAVGMGSAPLKNIASETGDVDVVASEAPTPETHQEAAEAAAADETSAETVQEAGFDTVDNADSAEAGEDGEAGEGAETLTAAAGEEEDDVTAIKDANAEAAESSPIGAADSLQEEIAEMNEEAAGSQPMQETQAGDGSEKQEATEAQAQAEGTGDAAAAAATEAEAEDPDKPVISRKVKLREPEKTWERNLDNAQILQTGDSVTLIAYGAITEDCLVVAENDSSIEVINLTAIAPLDTATCLESVKKTGRCLIVQDSLKNYGVGAELAADMAEHALEYLLAPIRRLGSVSVPQTEADLPLLDIEEIRTAVDELKAFS